MIGICANWFQWFFNADRPIFIFYAITILPFVVLAQTLLIGKLEAAVSFVNSLFMHCLLYTSPSPRD